MEFRHATDAGCRTAGCGESRGRGLAGSCRPLAVLAWNSPPFRRRIESPILGPMTRTPDDSKKPAKKPKDPAKPTRAKASRPDTIPIGPALADLLNPAINRGEAGVGSQTGLQPPPDNSRDRRANFSAAHRARKSTATGFGEAPQSPYRDNPELREASPELARILGIEG